MKQVMVRLELVPHMDRIASVLSSELMKIEDNDDDDRAEVMLFIALSMLLHIANDDSEFARAIALRLITDVPSKDSELQMVRSTVLSPEFAKTLPEFYNAHPALFRKH